MRFLASVLALIGAVFAAPTVAQYVPNAVTGRPTPPAEDDPENLWYLDLSDGGRVIIGLRPDAAPLMVARIKTLTRQHFYDGLPFHRVIDGFMAQSGDPQGTGAGGSTLPNVPSEFNFLPHVRGAVAAARTDTDTNSANSQFFIMLTARLALDHHYTVFGRVISGIEYVDAMPRGEPPANPTRVIHAYIAADHPPAYAPGPPTPLPPPAALGAPVTLPGAAPTRPAAPHRPAPRRTRHR